MTTLEMISELYLHMAWADAKVWRHVLSNETIAENKSIRGLLHHVHLVQRAYLSIWTGAALEFREESSFESSAALVQWAHEGHDRIAAFVASIRADRLEEIVKLPWVDRLPEEFGTPHEMTFGETLLQIPMHSMNHRGQVLTKLRELGSAAPILDFIAWVWHGKPAADWP